MRFIAHCYNELGNIKEAKSWLYRSIAECSDIREPYLAMARIGYKEKNWAMVYAMVQLGLKIKKSSGSYLNEPEVWGYIFYDLGAISSYYLGLYEVSRQYSVQALQLSPLDERLKNNLSLIQKKTETLKTREV